MRRYGIWLAAATVSLLGTQVLGFAMAWVAAGRGGAFAGLVLTAINLPRVLLLLAGGAAADRVGAWRVMIVADVVMAVVMLALAGAALARALSARQLAGQLVAAAGPPLGALAVAPGAPAAIGAGLVAGLGNGLFSAHIAPLVLGAAPATHLARIQAVLVFVQSVPLLVTDNALGGLADAGSASVVLLVCASALAVATAVTAVRSDLPSARPPGEPRSAGVPERPVGVAADAQPG